MITNNLLFDLQSKGQASYWSKELFSEIVADTSNIFKIVAESSLKVRVIFSNMIFWVFPYLDINLQQV